MHEHLRFSERLAALLVERGMTQMELAERIGVTRAAMSRYVSGEREPRFVTIVQIAHELDVPLDFLAHEDVEAVDSAIRLVARHRLSDEQVAKLHTAINEGERN